VKVYVVYCHPTHDSLIGAALERALRGLEAGGHDVRLSDLYVDGFTPELSLAERSQMMVDHRAQPEVRAELAGYINNLEWCDTLVVVYPTWWGGQPAMLKGWLDRVLVPGVAYEVRAGADRISPLLRNVRMLVTITSHGSTKRINALQGEPGKRTISRSLRAVCHRRCRAKWIAIYNIDRCNESRRQRFLDRVERHMRALPSLPAGTRSGAPVSV
jgi:NAD(P)H dehydrogenase (quinone)